MRAQRPNKHVPFEVVVDHPQTTSPTLTPPQIRPPHFAKDARALDDLPLLGVVREMDRDPQRNLQFGLRLGF
jgi:hypothetical protein